MARRRFLLPHFSAVSSHLDYIYPEPCLLQSQEQRYSVSSLNSMNIARMMSQLSARNCHSDVSVDWLTKCMPCQDAAGVLYGINLDYLCAAIPATTRDLPGWWRSPMLFHGPGCDEGGVESSCWKAVPDRRHKAVSVAVDWCWRSISV